MDLSSQVAVITGGASGMGAATAERLAELGVKVALLDMNEQALENVASRIQGVAVRCDVSNQDDIQRALTTIVNKLGPARIFVNCAGIAHSRRMVNKEGPMPSHEFRHIIQVNLVGTFNVMSLAAAQMIPLEPVDASGERGVIINTASIAAFEGQTGQIAYSASKGAIVSMTLPAARELAQFGIRVMTIAPGLVDTPMFSQLSEEARTSLAASVPFPKRLAKPEEFASLVLQIIQNPMLNGEVIRLDGGLRMQASPASTFLK